MTSPLYAVPLFTIAVLPFSVPSLHLYSTLSAIALLATLSASLGFRLLPIYNLTLALSLLHLLHCSVYSLFPLSLIACATLLTYIPVQPFLSPTFYIAFILSTLPSYIIPPKQRPPLLLISLLATQFFSLLAASTALAHSFNPSHQIQSSQSALTVLASATLVLSFIINSYTPTFPHPAQSQSQSHHRPAHSPLRDLKLTPRNPSTSSSFSSPPRNSYMNDRYKHRFSNNPPPPIHPPLARTHSRRFPFTTPLNSASSTTTPTSPISPPLPTFHPSSPQNRNSATSRIFENITKRSVRIVPKQKHKPSPIILDDTVLANKQTSPEEDFTHLRDPFAARPAVLLRTTTSCAFESTSALDYRDSNDPHKRRRSDPSAWGSLPRPPPSPNCSTTHRKKKSRLAMNCITDADADANVPVEEVLLAQRLWRRLAMGQME